MAFIMCILYKDCLRFVAISHKKPYLSATRSISSLEATKAVSHGHYKCNTSQDGHCDPEGGPI